MEWLRIFNIIFDNWINFTYFKAKKILFVTSEKYCVMVAYVFDKY